MPTLPADAAEISVAPYDADRQRQVEAAGRSIARHLTRQPPAAGADRDPGRARCQREDAGFHAYQMLEVVLAKLAPSGAMEPLMRVKRILIAAGRYLAAHSPIERAAPQTADIARRLARGGRSFDRGRRDVLSAASTAMSVKPREYSLVGRYADPEVLAYTTLGGCTSERSEPCVSSKSTSTRVGTWARVHPWCDWLELDNTALHDAAARHHPVRRLPGA